MTQDLSPHEKQVFTESMETLKIFILIPLIMTIGVIVVSILWKGWKWTLALIGWAVFQFVAAGKFIVFFGLHEDIAAKGFTPEFFMFLVIYMDLLFACLTMFILPLLYKIPFVGKRLHAVRKNSEELLKANPWVRNTTFLALVGFVAFPFTGTGAVGGTFFGRMLGLSRKFTFAGIATGAVGGAGGMYLLALLFGDIYDRIKDNPLAKWFFLIGGIVFIGTFVMILTRRAKKGFVKQTPADEPVPSTTQGPDNSDK